MNFSDRMLREIDRKKNFSVVGLDPHIENIPYHIKEEALSKHGNSLKAIGEVFYEFNKQIINAISDFVAIVKPQIAFYEKYGYEGIKSYMKTIKYARKMKLIVIEDSKRNDIGSTAEAYSDGHIGKSKYLNGNIRSIYDVDALTINPYLGYDGIEPFIDDVVKYSKGCFILVKTSNKSSNEFQDLLLHNSKKLFEEVAMYVSEWGKSSIGSYGYSDVGAVVGATYPEEGRKLRGIMKKSIFLCPGYGAQGAKSSEIVKLFNNDGYGAIISNSRGIIFAYERLKGYSQDNFEDASLEAVKLMKNDINKNLKKNNRFPW